jgi:hypothetical protein
MGNKDMEPRPAAERKAERMTTAPAMPDFAKTVNAVVIRSSVGFERPALVVNK